MFVKLKSIFKIAPYLLVVCCILLISYFVLYLQDEELSEDAKEFFTSSQVTLENNFYVRWSDIHAPLDYSDAEGFGNKVYNKEINVKEVSIVEFARESIPYKNYCNKQKKFYRYTHYDPESVECYNDREISALSLSLNTHYKTWE